MAQVSDMSESEMRQYNEDIDMQVAALNNKINKYKEDSSAASAIGGKVSELASSECERKIQELTDEINILNNQKLYY